jgi:hypothetical protein
MRIHKNDSNVWLQGVRMEEYFPKLVKKFNSKKPSGAENETILNPVGDDLMEGYVSLYSTANDVAKIIQRASKAIKKIYMFTDKEKEVTGVDFLIDKDAFRGAVYAFNVNFRGESYDTGRKGSSLSDDHIAKMQEGRKNGKKKKE